MQPLAGVLCFQSIFEVKNLTPSFAELTFY